MKRSRITRRGWLAFSVTIGLWVIGGLPPSGAAEEPAAVRPFRFVQMCDTQLGFGGYKDDIARFEQAVNQINARGDVDFVVICGDLVNRADDQSYADFKRIKAGFAIPCHCASGNHDVGNKPTIETLERYRQRLGDDYFAVDHKGARFVIVNTQLWKSPVAGETEKQDAWLRKTLKEAKAAGRPVFIVGHYPLFTDSPDEPEGYFSLAPAKRRELLDLYASSGVVAILAGHTHKTVVHNYRGIEMVCSATTSKNFDNKPFGFRVWSVDKNGGIAHEFVPLGGGLAERPTEE